MSGRDETEGRRPGQSSIRDILAGETSLRPNSLDEITNVLFGIAMVELHRANDHGDTARADNILNHPEYGGLISQLLRPGSVEIVDDEDDDPNYHPGQEEDNTLDQGQDEDEDEDEDGMLDAEELDIDIDDDWEDTGNAGRGWNQSLPPRQRYYSEPVTKPQPAGVALLYSGEFGRIKHQTRTRNKDNNIARTLLDRGSKLRPSTREDITTVRPQA